MQIEQLASRFEHEKIDAVYSSDLSRTCDTAAAICKPHGLTLRTTEKLREVNVGVWEDAAWGDLEYNEPEMCGYFGNDPARWRVAGSEEYAGVRARMTDCIREIAKRHDGETVAAFSHGFAIRSLFCEIMGIPSSETHKVPYCDNTAVALLLYENGALTFEYQGDNSHLHNEISTFANQKWWRGEKARYKENLRYMPIDEKRDAALLKLCGKESGCGFAAFIEDEPAGLLGLDTEKGSSESVGLINNVFVKPEFADSEFDIQLIGQAVSEYRRLGRSKLRIEIPPDRLEFYIKYGFVNTGDAGPLLLMEKDISTRK